MKANVSFPAGALALALALPAAAAMLPPAKTENGVTYVVGGIGHDESAAMKAAEKSYPLSMIFYAGKDNEYVADVKVAIKDKAGKTVLDTRADGPIMLVKVPAGRYTITADRNGKTLHHTVQVGAKLHKEADFHWPKA